MELFGKLEPGELKHLEEDKYEERTSNDIHLDLLEMHLRAVLSLKTIIRPGRAARNDILVRRLRDGFDRHPLWRAILA